MSDHLPRTTIEALRRRQLPPGELPAALRHIGECAECRLLASPAVDDAERVRAALEQPDDHRHLDFDTEIVPFVDDTAEVATRELVEEHMEECALCRREVNELLSVRRETGRPSRSRVWRMLAVAAAIVAVVAALIAFLLSRPEPAPAMRREQVRSPGPVQTPEPQPVPPRIAPSPLRYERAEWQALVDGALSRAALPVSATIASIAMRRQTMRGPGGEDDTGLSPVGVVVEADRPAFSWPAVEGAAYVVSVYEEDEEVANSGAIERPSWKPAQRLRRGRTYVWQVKVRQGDRISILPSPPVPQAMFHILGEEALRELATARTAHRDDHLLLAVLSARHGLTADARHHLRLLSEQPGELPPDVRRLVQRELPR
jgi:hypothetical protein